MARNEALHSLNARRRLVRRLFDVTWVLAAGFLMSSLATAGTQLLHPERPRLEVLKQISQNQNQVPMGMDKEASLWLHSRQPLG